MGPPTAVAGTVAVIVVSLTTVKVALTLLLNFTPVTLPPVIKLTPVIVTISPMLPTFGLMLLTAGQVSAGAIEKLASEMSKKIFPTASTFTRAVELTMPLGSVTASVPSFRVLAVSTIGKVFPPSVDKLILTLAQFTGAVLVLLTLQVTVCRPLSVPPPFGAVTANGPDVLVTVSTDVAVLIPPP